MLKPLRDERGSAVVAGVLFTFILLVLAAAIVDVYRLQDTRTFAYSAANDAALRGASLGRDWDSYTATGELYLDASAANDAAKTALEQMMQARRITNFQYVIGVLPNPGGGTFAMPAPCLLCASLWNTTVWTEDEPAVGVCTVVTVPTILFGLINGNQPIAVHAFAAAGVAQQ